MNKSTSLITLLFSFFDGKSATETDKEYVHKIVDLFFESKSKAAIINTEVYNSSSV